MNERLMKTRFIIFAAAVAALASCTKEPSMVDNQTPEGQKMSFTVVAEDTKTVLAEGKKTYWSGSESISIFAGTSNNEFTAKLSEPAASATFTGPAVTADTYVALYPYNASATLSSQVISTVIPASQVAVKDTFDPSSAILVGSSSDANMKLTNVCSLLKITVPDGVTSIEVEGNGTAIAGNVSIDLANGNAVSGATETKVTLSKADASVFEKGSYYVAVAPGTLNGVTVTLRDAVNKKHMTRKVESSRTLKGNVIYDMGEFGVVTDVKYLFDDAYSAHTHHWEPKELTITDEKAASGSKSLKWVYEAASGDSWNNHFQIDFSGEGIDWNNVPDPSKACLKYKVYLTNDQSSDQGSLFYNSFSFKDKGYEEDASQVKISRSGDSSPVSADKVVAENRWTEITLPLNDAITAIKDGKTLIGLRVKTWSTENAGTIVYFDDIRLEGCGFETASDVWVNDDVTPEPEPEDVTNIYTDSFGIGNIWTPEGSTPTLTESTESPATGTNCLKWVYGHTGTWNVCTISLPDLDLKNVENTEGASLVFKFRVADDKGPSGNWVIFQPYFNTNNGDVIVHGFTGSRGVGRSAAEANQFDFIVNDDQWHELTLPLSISIQSLKDKSALITGLSFSNMGEVANAGTVIYFDDIRLVGCGLNK